MTIPSILRKLEGGDRRSIGRSNEVVAEVLAENGIGKLTRHGLRDSFGESGTYEALYKKYRLDAEGIDAIVNERVGK